MIKNLEDISSNIKSSIKKKEDRANHLLNHLLAPNLGVEAKKENEEYEQVKLFFLYKNKNGFTIYTYL